MLLETLGLELTPERLLEVFNKYDITMSGMIIIIVIVIVIIIIIIIIGIETLTSVLSLDSEEEAITLYHAIYDLITITLSSSSIEVLASVLEQEGGDINPKLKNLIGITTNTTIYYYYYY